MQHLGGRTVDQREYPNPVFAISQNQLPEFRNRVNADVDSVLDALRDRGGRVNAHDYVRLRFMSRDRKEHILETIQDLHEISGVSSVDLKVCMISQLRKLFGMQIVDEDGKPCIPSPGDESSKYYIYSSETSEPFLSRFSLDVISQILGDSDMLMLIGSSLKGQSVEGLPPIEPKDLLRRFVETEIKKRGFKELSLVSGESVNEESLDRVAQNLATPIVHSKSPLLEVFESGHGKSDILRALLMCPQLKALTERASDAA